MIATQDAIKNTSKLSGYFIGTVVDNKDPLQIGRVKVTIPGIWDGIETSMIPWTNRSFNPSDTSNNSVPFCAVPEEGSQLLVVFINNDIYTSLYVGQLLTEGYDFDELRVDYPETYGFTDKTGNKFFVNMRQNTLTFIHSSGTKLNIDREGTVTIDIEKDKNTTVNKNLSLHVKGDSTVNIDGKSDITVKKDATINVSGNVKETVGGNMDIAVSGTYTLNASTVNIN